MRPLFHASRSERLARARWPAVLVAIAAGVGIAVWAATPRALHADTHAASASASGSIRADRLRPMANDAANDAAKTEGAERKDAAADVANSPTVPLLVARPDLQHPVFRNAVIFAAPLPSGGHLGIILNRPTDAKMGEIFPDHEPSQRVAEPVFFGGPVQSEIIVAVIRSDSRPSEQAMPIARQMYLAFDAPTIDDAIEKNADHSRFYAGFVVWPPQTLERQIAEGLWSVKQVEAGKMLNKETAALWPELTGGKAAPSNPATKPIHRGPRTPDATSAGRVIHIGGRVGADGAVR